MITNGPAGIQANLGHLSDYSLQLNRWYSKPIGAWPPSSATTKLQQIVSIILNIFCYVSISFTMIPCLLYMVLEDDDIQKKLKMFATLSHWFVGTMDYTTLLLRSKEIRYCVEHIEMDWRIITRAKDQSVMLKNAKYGRYVAACCAGFMQVGVLYYYVVIAFSTEVVNVGNETRTVHMLPCAVYKKLLNVDTSPTKEIVLASQFLSCVIVNSGAVAVFSLAAVCAAHAYGQLDVLMIWINEYVNESGEHNKGPNYSGIGVIVEHHLRVLSGCDNVLVWQPYPVSPMSVIIVYIDYSFISRIEEVMHRICLLELIRSTSDICMVGYYTLTELSARNSEAMTASNTNIHLINVITGHSMALISSSFNIFILCYIGEVLTEQCKKIGEVVYMTDWYHLPYKNVHNLIMIVARSSVVTKITAGKLVHMSIYTFGDVFKTAFAYLNILRQMT